MLRVLEKEPLREKRNFCFERLLKRFPLRNEDFVFNYILLVVVFNAIVAVVLSYTGEFHLWISLIHANIGFGAVPTVLGLFALIYLRDKSTDSIKYFKKEGKLANHEQVENLAIKIFLPRFQILIIMLSVLGGLVYQIYLLEVDVWKYSFVWWVQATSWVVIFSQPLVGLLLLFCSSNIFLTHNIGKNLLVKADDIFHPDRMAGLGKLSALSLVNLFSWAIVGSYFVGGFLRGELETVMILSIATYGVVLVVLFIVPLLSVRTQLKNEKARLMLEVGGKIVQAEKELADTNGTGSVKVLMKLYRQKILLEQIEKIKEWPLDFEVFLKAVGGASIPLLAYLIKALLSVP